MEAPIAQATAHPPPSSSQQQTAERRPSRWANKFRGAVVEDLDLPPALSTSPYSPISTALMSAYEREYTHLTVIDPGDKSLLGYVSIPRLRELLETKQVKDEDLVEKAMIKFKRKGKRYRLITMETPLEELEAFFDGYGTNEKQDFAVVTDPARRFVLGVATKGDLEEFLRRRPG